jgi:hypothetical protein
MAKLPARLTGAFLLAGSCGTTLIHREIWEAVHRGPPQVIELGISLLTFVLASTGLLLLIHGSRLFSRHPGFTGRSHERDANLARRLAEPITLVGRAFDTRNGVAMMQARHAIASASGTPMRTRSRPLLGIERQSNRWLQR